MNQQQQGEGQAAESVSAQQQPEQWCQQMDGVAWEQVPCSLQLQQLTVLIGAFMVAACKATVCAHGSVTEPEGHATAGVCRIAL